MKKFISFFLCVWFACFAVSSAETPRHRGLFVSVIQDPPVLSSRQEISKLIDSAKELQIDTLFVQIYRANKAWFRSKVGDSASYQAAMQEVGEDPFTLLIQEAHKNGIEVHAWLNLLSLSDNPNAKILKKYGPKILTQNGKKKKKLEDYKIDNQYFLEPGDLRVRKELSKMVAEIVRAYPDLNGLQFDYIRYPDKDPPYGYTKMNMTRFKKAAGVKRIDEDSKAWKDWKRDQVTSLLKELIAKARTVRPEIQISTTGLMPYSRALHEGFQDWKYWIESGLVHFVTLMCYNKDTSKFEEYILNAKENSGNFENVNLAVGTYVFVRAPEKFKRQFELCEHSGSRGCVIFHYGSLVENPALMEPLKASRKAA